ncbi:hypothetical protein OKW41_005135 [Paraburkholderia sp. UCT70]
MALTIAWAQRVRWLMPGRSIVLTASSPASGVPRQAVGEIHAVGTRHRIVKGARLIFERRRYRGLLNQRGILLGRVVHLRDRAVELLDAARLFFRSHADFAHDTGYIARSADDFRHRGASAGREFGSILNLCDRPTGRLPDLFRRCRRALCQCTYFACQHRESTPFVASTRSFDGGIQREYVGLECDTLDCANNVDDPVRSRRHVRDQVDDLLDNVAAARAEISDAFSASALACRALSAFCLIVEVNSSMLDAVSSSVAACCSVRVDRSALPLAISRTPCAIAAVSWRTWLTAATSALLHAGKRPHQPAHFVDA